jgi:succinate dehydrogenase/fumarate reductase flavoprotein subunit
MDASTQDLLQVGGGAVGLRTAVAVTELNAKLNIAIVSKVHPNRARAQRLAANRFCKNGAATHRAARLVMAQCSL